MSTSDFGVGRMEPIDVSLESPTPVSPTDPTLAALSSQLVHLTTVVTELKSNVDHPDHRPIDVLVSARPPPAPPFGSATAAQGPHPMPIFTYTRRPLWLCPTWASCLYQPFLPCTPRGRNLSDHNRLAPRLSPCLNMDSTSP